MPDQVSDHTNLKNQYASQVASDLENNATEQERIGLEITSLQGQLRDLERDHALLVNMQQALVDGTSTAAADAPAPAVAPAPAAPKPARLPKARTPKDTEAGTRGPAAGQTKQTRTAKDTTAAKTAKVSKPAKTAARPVVKEPAPSPKATGTPPTLRELVSEQLSTHNEPRSAAEVTAALAEAHPGRKASATVVRNTLEALVAKGLAHRSKQQKSVFYSASADASASTGADEAGTTTAS